MPKLECRIEDGMLPREASIFFEGMERRYESWVARRDVEMVGKGKGLVPIRIVDRDEQRDALLVELPSEVILGTRRVWVRSDLVR
jgi:hypothetical protein